MKDERTRATELESFLETVPGMIYRTHFVPPYDIAFVSEEMTAVAGFPPADFIGPNPKRRWVDLIHPDDREVAAQKMLAAPADGTVVEVEYRVRRGDGGWAWIYSRARKVIGPDGDPWLHGAAIDATARHEAEDLRRRLEAEEARSAAIEASRARIVAAADEARRQIERDLHDGAQQRLVVASLTLRRAAQGAGTDVDPLLAEALEHVQAGLIELRELAQGIHPSVLSERGLVAALEGLAARASVPVGLSVDAAGLPPAVESALYFTVAEALTNVAKHARAASAEIDVRTENGCVTAEVRDDGVGGASAAAGSGLRGLADRLDALGGSLEIECPPTGGTVVRAHLPFAQLDA